MSSILKALQRLQGDRGEGAPPEPQPALGDELARELAEGPARSGADPASRARLTLLGVAAAALVLAMTGFGWWLARGFGPEEAAPAAPPPVARSEPPPEPAPPSGTLRRAPPARPSASPEEAPTLPASVAPEGEAPAEVAAAPLPSAAPPPSAAPAPAEAAKAAVPAATTAPASRVAPAADSPAPPAEAPRIELAAEPTPAAPAGGSSGARAPAKPPSAPPVAAPAPAAPPSAPPPSVEVLRTTWHPRPERRVARIRVGGFAAPVEVREGDAVSTLVVKTIEPSGVLFLHGGAELRRTIGKP